MAKGAISKGPTGPKAYPSAPIPARKPGSGGQQGAGLTSHPAVPAPKADHKPGGTKPGKGC
jgi:hypothetical protein